MVIGIEGVLKEYEHKTGAPLLGAAETGEYAWGVEDSDTPHRVSAIRLPSPVRYAKVLYPPRRHKTGGQPSNDPLASLAQEKGLRNDVEIEVFDCRGAMKSIKTEDPRQIHFLQSPVRYIELADELQQAKQHVMENSDPLRYASKYATYARKQVEMVKESGDQLTAGNYVGIVASAARAHYIARNRAFPPMNIDEFREEAAKDIEVGAATSKLDEAVALLRRCGRDEPFSCVGAAESEYNAFFNEELEVKYSISRRERVNTELLDDAVTSLYQKHYNVE